MIVHGNETYKTCFKFREQVNKKLLNQDQSKISILPLCKKLPKISINQRLKDKPKKEEETNQATVIMFLMNKNKDIHMSKTFQIFIKFVEYR